MMKYPLTLFFTILVLVVGYSSFAQTLPVGSPLLEETWRRMQIAGERDINTSFTIRPLYAGSQEEYDSIYNPQNFLAEKKSTGLNYAKGKGLARLLPISLKQQYNTHHPYGWNDGSMIQAKGYQTQLSFGIYSRIGPLSIQLQPELVYAQNKAFSTFRLHIRIASGRVITIHSIALTTPKNMVMVAMQKFSLVSRV